LPPRAPLLSRRAVLQPPAPAKAPHAVLRQARHDRASVSRVGVAMAGAQSQTARELGRGRGGRNRRGMIHPRMPRWFHRRVFRNIFRRNAWGSEESVSGPGSTRARGDSFSADMVELLQRLDARKLLDAPCGDFNWMDRVADRVESYVGIDIVDALIARNAQLHANE